MNTEALHPLYSDRASSHDDLDGFPWELPD
jgi:hypothetical protein